MYCKAQNLIISSDFTKSKWNKKCQSWSAEVETIPRAGTFHFSPWTSVLLSVSQFVHMKWTDSLSPSVLLLYLLHKALILFSSSITDPPAVWHIHTRIWKISGSVCLWQARADISLHFTAGGTINRKHSQEQFLRGHPECF